MVTYHKTDRLFIIAKTKVTIDLYSPKLKYNFLKSNSNNKHKQLHNFVIKDNKKLDNMEIELQPKDILYIPRFWFFNINQKHSVDLFICNTILSNISSLFI